MISKEEKLRHLLNSLTHDEVRRVYDEWEQVAAARTQSLRAMVLADGFQEISDAPPDAVALPDGREILRVDGQAYALPIETHLLRLAEAMEATKKAQPVLVRQKPGEGLASVLCPLCGSVMAKSPICPNCSAGRKGFKILCTCTDCGHEVYL